MDGSSGLLQWVTRHAGLGVSVQLGLLLVVCLLTWFDPLVRRDRATAGIAVGGWVAMSLLGTWRGAWIDDPSGVIAWAVACLYVLVVLATLGRPILMLSDLLAEKQRDERMKYPDSLWRRAYVAQGVVIVSIVVGLFLLFYL